MMHAAQYYNRLMDHIDELEERKRIFVIAPSEAPDVSRLERDPEKLYRLYRMGAANTERRIPAIRRYLGMPEEAVI
jgi:predicted patatin/cPLA2 family phospholipase